MKSYPLPIVATIVLVIVAGCTVTPPAQPLPAAPPTQAPPTRAAAAQKPAASALPSSNASPDDLMKTFNDAFNRHDLDALSALFGANAVISLSKLYGENIAGAFTARGSQGIRDSLPFLFALHAKVNAASCSTQGGNATCKLTFSDDCGPALGVPEVRFDPAMFTIKDGKIVSLIATMVAEDADKVVPGYVRLQDWGQKNDSADLAIVLEKDRFHPEKAAALSRLCGKMAANR